MRGEHGEGGVEEGGGGQRQRAFGVARRHQQKGGLAPALVGLGIGLGLGLGLGYNHQQKGGLAPACAEGQG